MSLEVKSLKIGDDTYEVTLFPAMQGYLLGRRVAEIFVSGADNISGYFAKLNEIDKDGSFTLELLSNSIKNKEPITKENFNRLFSGSSGLIAVSKLVNFVIEVNFKDFLQVNSTGNQEII